jgi:hypothetical protein
LREEPTWENWCRESESARSNCLQLRSAEPKNGSLFSPRETLQGRRSHSPLGPSETSEKRLINTDSVILLSSWWALPKMNWCIHGSGHDLYSRILDLAASFAFFFGGVLLIQGSVLPFCGCVLHAGTFCSGDDGVNVVCVCVFVCGVHKQITESL